MAVVEVYTPLTNTPMTKEEKLNKTIAKFQFRGKKCEIDELLDSGDRENGFGEYDIFCGDEYVGHLSEKLGTAPKLLVKFAKEELKNNPL